MPPTVINEIMYNPKGSDTGQEWIELINTSFQRIDLSKWKVEINGRKHRLNPPPKNGGQGSIIIQPNQYFIIASDAKKFLTAHPNYSGTVIDSSFSLTNKSGEIEIIDDQKQVIDQLNYSSAWGGNGNGKTLAKINLSLDNNQQNWTDSQQDGGTPGQKNDLSAAPQKNSQTQSIDHPSVSPSHQSNYSNLSHASTSPSALSIIPSHVSTTSSLIKAETRENLIYALTNQVIQFDGTNSTMPTGTKIIWNFGDGQTDSKIKVQHRYSFPGEYLPTLNLAFGSQTSQAKMKIIIYPRNVFINEFYPNPRGRDSGKEWIEIVNKNNFPVDLSGYKIANGLKKSFCFPTGSLIAPQNYLIIQPKIALKNSSSSLSFFYPNNSLLQRIIYPSVQEGWSVARNDQGKFYFTAQPTPGTTNLIATTTFISKISSSTLLVKNYHSKTKSEIKSTENYVSGKNKTGAKKRHRKRKTQPKQKIDEQNLQQNNNSNWPSPTLQSNSQKPLPIAADISQISHQSPKKKSSKLIPLLFSLSLIASGIIWLIKG